MSSQNVVLGGSHRGRGIIGGRRSPLEWVGLGLFVALGASVLLGSSANLWLAPVAVLVALIGVGLFTPFEFFLDGRSLGASAGLVAIHRWRRMKGRTQFVPAYAQPEQPAAETSGKNKRVKAPVDVPEALGSITPLNLEFEGGSTICVLRHNRPGGRFLTATFEMRGGTGSVSDLESQWRPHQCWSRFVTSMASHGSLVTSLQQVARVVPFDTRDHTEWILSRRPRRGWSILDESYRQLLDNIPQIAEQHRTWLVVTMPITPAWASRAKDYGRGDQADLLLAVEQLRTVERRAQAEGIQLRALSETQLAGVIRALQDPDQPLDQPIPAGMSQAFLPWDDGAPKHLIVQGSVRDWYTRTAYVRGTGLSGQELPPDFLRPVITAVQGSVPRTITTSINLVPAPRARRTAKSHAARDRASMRSEAERTVSDGSAETQAAGSYQRMQDLTPGSGINGANWSMAISYAASSPEELASANDLIGSATDASFITRLTYADRDHQTGLTTCLPVGLGIRAEKGRL